MPTTPTLLLPYPAPADPADVPLDMQELADRIETVRGAVNGLASLDAGGKVPVAQLPAIGSAPGYGTALPGSPTDGQEYILVDSVTAPTYQWRFRYNNGHSVDAFKWEFVGGTPIVLSAAGEVTGGNAWQITGPSFAVPRAGVYILTPFFSYCRATTAGNTSQGGIGKNTSSAALASGLISTPVANYNTALVSPPFGITFAAGESGVIWVHGGAAGTVYGPRTLLATPVRL